jgi:hypothetical protein
VAGPGLLAIGQGIRVTYDRRPRLILALVLVVLID